MNKFIRKTAAVMAAAAIAVTGFSIGSSAEVKLSESVISVDYAAKVSKPSYSVKGAKGYRKIRLSTSTSGAVIYYTTNGSTPTTSSKQYNGLITIKKNTKIKAIAVKNGASSAVMTKTFRVATVLGDVTGDGSVTESDYTRLSNWIAGKTSYGCKDNADVTGNSRVNKTDLKYLRKYLDGEIDKFPAEGGSTNTSSSIERPAITVYRVYGGKKISIDSKDNDVTYYYTLNGKDPTKKSLRFTSDFVITSDATIKAVAYKDGKYSTIKTRVIDVDKCADVTLDKNPNEQFKDSVKVALNCTTENSKIYYTTDGTDPLRYGRLYSQPIELTSDTVLKVYSTSKGYADSDVKTYNFKVISTNYKITGSVWNDTQYTDSVADGARQYGEEGINGITVQLLNTSNNNVEQSVLTTTINNVPGSYILDKARAGNTYKVVFIFNGQKYRAYGSIVNGGNQATTGSLSALTIRNGGAYNSSGALVANVNNRAAATVSANYNISAMSQNSYTGAAQNVNLALATNVYGDLNLKFDTITAVSASTGATTPVGSGSKVYSNDMLTYTLTVSNNSPYQALNFAKINLYLDDSLSFSTAQYSYGSAANCTYVKHDGSRSIYSLVIPALAVDESISIKITAKVATNISEGVSIAVAADVAEYNYNGACYDKDSIPGNFSGYVRETDEAEAARVSGYTSLVSAQSITWSSGNDFTTPLQIGVSRKYTFTVVNGSTKNDVYINSAPYANIIGCELYTEVKGSVMECTLWVTPKAAGTGSLSISLQNASSKNINLDFTVLAAV